MSAQHIPQNGSSPPRDPAQASDRTALAGKSFGAITTLTAVYGADPIDSPIDDVVSMAGAMDDPSGAGRVETPLRLIHGELDERVPYRSSVDVFAAASASPPAHRHLTRIPIAVLTMDSRCSDSGIVEPV